MIRNLLICFLGLCTSVVSANTIEYSIGTYNVDNLWDADPDNTPAAWASFVKTLRRDQIPFGSTEYAAFSLAHSNYFEPGVIQTKVDHLVRAIELAGAPDVLALQELESAGNKSKVWESPSSKGTTLKEELQKLGYQYFWVGPQSETNLVSVTPGLISKVDLRLLPPIHVNVGMNVSARDIMVAEWNLSGSRTILINGHFKSKRDGGEQLRRMQAEAVRARIQEEKMRDPSVRVLVLGDLNCGYYEACMAPLGTTGDERAMLTPQGSPDLLNLWYELSEEDRWESSFNGVRGTLSQFLISHEFFLEYGLSYLPGTFKVVGQSGKEAAELMSPSGVPFEWQIRRTGGRGNDTYTHVGYGFSDHLPLVARFSYSTPSSEVENRKKIVQSPFFEASGQPPKKIHFDQTPPRCREDESTDLTTFQGRLEELLGQCVKFNADDGIPLVSSSSKDYSYITLGKLHFAVGMTRSWDWRPNIDDSRVTYADAAIPEGQYSQQFAHPHSNKCFFRLVLEGEGGKVRKLVGRVSFQDGHLAVLAASREPRDLVLSDLPPRKEKACKW